MPISVRLLWIVSRTAGRTGCTSIAYAFRRILAGLASGQLGIVLLLGVSLFLYLYSRRPQYLAGNGAARLRVQAPPLPALRRSAHPVDGPSASVPRVCRTGHRPHFVASIFALCIDAQRVHSILADDGRRSAHGTSIRAHAQQDVSTSAESGRMPRLQFVPAAAGCCWAAWYYIRPNAVHWTWANEGLLVLVVSVGMRPLCLVYGRGATRPCHLWPQSTALRRMADPCFRLR